MKRFLLVMLIGLLCLPFCACNQTPEETTAPPRMDTVGLCLRQQADAPEYYDALIQALKNAGFGVVIKDGKNDQSVQDQQVRGLLQMDCQVLVVEPVMVSALESVIEQAKAKNVPVLLIDREPEKAVLESYDQLYYVGCESAEAGTSQVRLLDKIPMQGDLNGDGLISYMILRGPEDHMDAQLITEGCSLALKQYETELICTVPTQWNVEAARAGCAQALAQFGRDIEVIFCNHAFLAAGAVQAVENSGWMPGLDVYILAVDTNAQLQELIDKGAVFGTVAPDMQQRVDTVVQIAKNIIEGKTPEKYTYVPFVS